MNSFCWIITPVPIFLPSINTSCNPLERSPSSHPLQHISTFVPPNFYNPTIQHSSTHSESEWLPRYIPTKSFRQSCFSRLETFFKWRTIMATDRCQSLAGLTDGHWVASSLLTFQSLKGLAESTKECHQSGCLPSICKCSTTPLNPCPRLFRSGPEPDDPISRFIHSTDQSPSFSVIVYSICLHLVIL